MSRISRLVRARTAGLELAALAFVDVPVRTRVTHVAVPEDQGGIGLNNLEGVHATAWDSHCFTLVSGLSMKSKICKTHVLRLD